VQEAGLREYFDGQEGKWGKGNFSQNSKEGIPKKEQGKLAKG